MAHMGATEDDGPRSDGASRRHKASSRSGLIRTVLVTGASSGIGAACAARLAGAGWRVLAGIRSGEAPAGTEAVQLDVTNGDDVRRLSEIGSLDALVNNAGIAVAAPLEFLPPEEL